MGNRVTTSFTMPVRLRQALENRSAATGITMSTLVVMALEKQERDLGFYGMSAGAPISITAEDVSGYRRRRPRRDLEARTA